MIKNTDSARKLALFPATQTWLGTDRPEISADGEGIIRKRRLKAFALETCAVSVARFAHFIEETGHVTDAERLGWTYVFAGLLDGKPDASSRGAAGGTRWWIAVERASWHHPVGESGPAAASDHPVTQVSWQDATAFAAWAGGRLPTEAEWEHAARGGRENRRYPWGDEEPGDEEIYCNIWQGRFPVRNTCRDGYYGTAPAKSFAANPAGLYNMSGNVWEWLADPFRNPSRKRAATQRNEAARKCGDRVLKGGSFLCHASYCWRYRIAARSGRAPDTTASHTGFRIAYDSDGPG